MVRILCRQLLSSVLSNGYRESNLFDKELLVDEASHSLFQRSGVMLSKAATFEGYILSCMKRLSACLLARALTHLYTALLAI